MSHIRKERKASNEKHERIIGFLLWVCCESVQNSSFDSCTITETLGIVVLKLKIEFIKNEIEPRVVSLAGKIFYRQGYLEISANKFFTFFPMILKITKISTRNNVYFIILFKETHY